jgi:hypothetical protein
MSSSSSLVMDISTSDHEMDDDNVRFDRNIDDLMQDMEFVVHDIADKDIGCVLKLNIDESEQSVNKKSVADFIKVLPLGGYFYQKDNFFYKKEDDRYHCYYKCSAIKRTQCKARLVDRGDGTSRRNDVEHSCNPLINIGDPVVARYRTTNVR